MTHTARRRTAESVSDCKVSDYGDSTITEVILKICKQISFSTSFKYAETMIDNNRNSSAKKMRTIVDSL